MLTKSEFLFCGTAAVGLLAYSVSHQVDPAVAASTLADNVLQATIYGVKTGAHIVWQATKASAIVFGTFAALKVAVAAGKHIKNKAEQRLETIQEENEQECDVEEDVLEENNLSPFTIHTWDEAEYDEEDDDDYENEEEPDIIENILPEDAVTLEEIQLLLSDQKRVVFNHGAIKLPPLQGVENTYLKGPYRLRPR